MGNIQVANNINNIGNLTQNDDNNTVNYIIINYTIYNNNVSANGEDLHVYHNFSSQNTGLSEHTGVPPNGLFYCEIAIGVFLALIVLMCIICLCDMRKRDDEDEGNETLELPAYSVSSHYTSAPLDKADYYGESQWPSEEAPPPYQMHDEILYKYKQKKLYLERAHGTLQTFSQDYTSCYEKAF